MTTDQTIKALRAALELALAWILASGLDKQPGGREAIATMRAALKQ